MYFEWCCTARHSLAQCSAALRGAACHRTPHHTVPHCMACTMVHSLHPHTHTRHRTSCTQPCAHACTQTLAHAHAHARTHVCTHARMHAHTHALMHAHKIHTLNTQNPICVAQCRMYMRGDALHSGSAYHDTVRHSTRALTQTTLRAKSITLVNIPFGISTFELFSPCGATCAACS